MTRTKRETRRGVAWAVLAGLAVTALYALAPWPEALTYDDELLVAKDLRPRSVGDLAHAFTEPHYGGLPYYRPVARVSYLAQTPMGDGEHVVAITYTDAYGNQAQASHKFYIDNAPPYVKKLTPGQNQAVAGPRPTFVLEYTDDGSGIDLDSFEALV